MRKVGIDADSARLAARWDDRSRPMRENAAAKGRRLLTEGRLVVTNVNGSEIAASCRGDSGDIYRCGHVTGQWYCDCAALGRCAHMTALMLVTLRTDRRIRP